MKRIRLVRYFVFLLVFTATFMIVAHADLRKAWAVENSIGALNISYENFGWGNTQLSGNASCFVKSNGRGYLKFHLVFPETCRYGNFTNFTSYSLKGVNFSDGSSLSNWTVNTYDSATRTFIAYIEIPENKKGLYINSFGGSYPNHTLSVYVNYYGGNENTGTGDSFKISTPTLLDESWWKPLTVAVSTPDNQFLSETAGNNILTIAGNVKNTDIGNTTYVKYSIDGLTNHNSVTAATNTANGSNQPFSYNITINNTIPEGPQTLRVWAEDSYGQKSNEILLNFFVSKSVGANGVPVLRVITGEKKMFNAEINSGSYSDVTNSFFLANTGSGKPFYLRSALYRLNGANCTFYDDCSTTTYIGNNKLRVVTAEGKAFDVDSDTGDCTDVSRTFLVSNFGQGKPFYNRIYRQSINGYGPFTFFDFSSTMAYIGNNTIRVVTSEGKAFDVDKDTGAYTEVTANFINANNFGPGKPFFLREYTHTIGGEAKTFYDWGSSMTYIGNNTLRVVTSEGKAFDVDVNDGHIINDVTSTFLVNNFGAGKPFYLRTYPVTINGTSYNFYDWGCTFAYTGEWNPTLSITSPPAQAAFDTITLTGTVSNKNNNDVTVTADINGVAAQPVTKTGTATAQTWTLTWNIGANAVPEGTYSNIEVTATDAVTGEVSKETYTGTIFAFGPNSNMTRKTVVYEYDENGKLINRRIVNNP